jgi:UDP-N-acetylglucosamine 2-epimerase (non-hydrolysing)
VCTLHRPSNTDTLDAANNSVAAIEMLSARLPVVFPVHPRTRARLVDFGLLERLLQSPGTRLIEPLGYLDFLALMDQARLIFTDSGGIQEETTMLGVPCLTFRDTTERPITVTDGTNHLVGLDPVQTGSAADAILDGSVTKGRIPELWDGQAAKRILQVLTCAPRWNRPDPAKTPARLSPDGCTDSSIST